MRDDFTIVDNLIFTRETKITVSHEMLKAIVLVVEIINAGSNFYYRKLHDIFSRKTESDCLIRISVCREYCPLIVLTPSFQQACKSKWLPVVVFVTTKKTPRLPIL